MPRQMNLRVAIRVNLRVAIRASASVMRIAVAFG